MGHNSRDGYSGEGTSYSRLEGAADYLRGLNARTRNAVLGLAGLAVVAGCTYIPLKDTNLADVKVPAISYNTQKSIGGFLESLVEITGITSGRKVDLKKATDEEASSIFEKLPEKTTIYLDRVNDQVVTILDFQGGPEYNGPYTAKNTSEDFGGKIPTSLRGTLYSAEIEGPKFEASKIGGVIMPGKMTPEDYACRFRKDREKETWRCGLEKVAAYKIDGYEIIKDEITIDTPSVSSPEPTPPTPPEPPASAPEQTGRGGGDGVVAH